MTITRRALLEQVGAVGGLGATYMAMEALGLAMPTPAGAENFALPLKSGAGKSVVILGAGIAGLVSAYELKRAAMTSPSSRRATGSADGYGRSGAATGSSRPAGPTSMRNSIGGYTSTPVQRGSPPATAQSSATRAGSACRWKSSSMPIAAPWEFGGKVNPERRLINDMRGRLAELLAKAIDQHALDQHVPRDELDLVRKFLGPYADLDAVGNYHPQGRSGYSVEGGAYKKAPVPLPPLTSRSSSAAGGGQSGSSPFLTYFEQIWDMQATMLQPVGGMDRIAEAIYDQVKPQVRLNAIVNRIRRTGARVRIEHGAGRSAKPILHLHAAHAGAGPHSVRFLVCEEGCAGGGRLSREREGGVRSAAVLGNDDSIFGGLAWTDRLNENVMYPSGGYGDDKGVLVAAYAGEMDRPENPEAFAALTHEQRLQICRDSVEALHPGKSRLLGKGVTVAWGLTPYSEGVRHCGPGG